MKKNLILAFIVSMLLSAYYVGSVYAVVTITPLKMQQGKLMVAEIPQFENGMDAKFICEYNKMYRQLVLVAFEKFETVAWKTRDYTQIPEHMKNSMTFHAGYEVFRNDLQFISLTQKLYQYTGGAHGIGWMAASTIQLQTGKAYKLGNLFVDGADFAARLSDFVRQEGVARKLPLWGFKGIRPDSSFYLTDEGVVLFFQPYEIAPYSEGIVRMLIQYRDLDDILQPELGK